MKAKLIRSIREMLEFRLTKAPDAETRAKGEAMVAEYLAKAEAQPESFFHGEDSRSIVLKLNNLK
ncbi:hypothetical protein [Pseudothauera rhizosphaerae]|uniref:Uncharacterized protein n=1 Tax=Pseudothauera rhizosphaerae TaxID=2565932 RepID=A0A4S4AYC3_9RHOO|nr:hypothetical protein [Pseudothauera rhizosphaerae]THF64328.1 hypothetical protein E6O51_03185 [Pseudothauera rhizosphaerae]